jgi:sugar-specific transcriptional regulator TrmB
VYDAVRVLETKGLVEIQHSNPQVFRAVSIDEAAETLQIEYETRTETLRETLRGIDPAPTGDDVEFTHEVWALTGSASVTARTRELIAGADEEVVLIVGDEDFLPDTLVTTLKEAVERGVSVVVGTPSGSVQEAIERELPEAEVFVSGLEWLTGPVGGDETEIGRLVLVDRSAILISSVDRAGGSMEERAVFGRGFGNGLVVVFRRLLATGLLPVDDPGADY